LEKGYSMPRFLCLRNNSPRLHFERCQNSRPFNEHRRGSFRGTGAQNDGVRVFLTNCSPNDSVMFRTVRNRIFAPSSTVCFRTGGCGTKRSLPFQARRPGMVYENPLQPTISLLARQCPRTHVHALAGGGREGTCRLDRIRYLYTESDSPERCELSKRSVHISARIGSDIRK
jgi:hypothetical protein